MSTWQMRIATGDDLDAIMAIESAVFGTDAWSPETMRAELANAQNYYLVAFPPDKPQQIDGYAGLFAPRGAIEGDIQTIAVAAGARRKGLGRALVQTLVGEARGRGLREVYLEVRADNPHAQALYGSLGFEQLAIRVGYYQPDAVDAIVMRLAIPPATIAPAQSTAGGDA